MSRALSRRTLYCLATLVAFTQVHCSVPNRVYPDEDAGVGGSSSTGGTRTAPAKTTISGASSTGGSTSSSAVGGASESGGTSPVGGTFGTQTSGGNSTVAGSQATGGGQSTSTGATPGTSAGGTSSTGGSSSAQGGTPTTGGTSAILVTGGAPMVGGAATGGKTSTGGAPATGGVATGGAPTGGAATGGAPAINQFANGPCVTSTDLSSLDVYASNGANIYHKAITASSSSGWTKVPLLDATQLDIRSRLDCSASTNTVRLVATGSNPVGAYMHAVGFGNAFSAFTRELPTKTFSPPGVAVAAWGDNVYWMAGAQGNPVLMYQAPADPGLDYSPALSNYSLTSAPDMATHSTLSVWNSNPTHIEIVAFLGMAQMLYYDYSYGYGRYYLPVVTLSPPEGTFTYSPTVCSHTDTAAGDYTRHVAVVAGGKLYSAHSGADWAPDETTTFSAWEVAGDIAPASAPDCLVTSDNTVHVVFLTNAGTIAHVSRTGTSGAWSKADLGSY